MFCWKTCKKCKKCTFAFKKCQKWKTIRTYLFKALTPSVIHFSLSSIYIHFSMSVVQWSTWIDDEAASTFVTTELLIRRLKLQLVITASLCGSGASNLCSWQLIRIAFDTSHLIVTNNKHIVYLLRLKHLLTYSYKKWTHARAHTFTHAFKVSLYIRV